MSYSNLPLINEDEFNAVRSSIGEKVMLMLEYYIEDTELYLEQIMDGYNNGDFQAILSAAHTLKSSSRQIGAVRLGQISSDIEEDGKALLEKGVEDVKELSVDIEQMPEIVSETLSIYKAKQ